MPEPTDEHKPTLTTLARAAAPDPRPTAVFIVLTIAGIFIIDLMVPGNIQVPMLYTVPLLACARLRQARWAWAVAAACVALAFLDLFIGAPPVTFRWHFPWVNRAIVSLAFLACAALTTGLIRARMALERANAALDA